LLQQINNINQYHSNTSGENAKNAAGIGQGQAGASSLHALADKNKHLSFGGG